MQFALPHQSQTEVGEFKETLIIKVKRLQMATKRVARAGSILRHVTAFLLIMFLFLAQYAAAAGESNKQAILRGREHHYPDNNLHVYPRFQKSSQAAIDEAEDTEATSEPHPADELLQSQDADGSQSYILGGY